MARCRKCWIAAQSPAAPDDQHRLIEHGRHTMASAETLVSGDLSGLPPVTGDWGYSRGQPIDRFYIEQFLSRHRHDIRGHVLEIGDDSYTRRFGETRVTKSTIVDVRVD